MNNKLGIITFHTALNYGAVLQTYALQKFLSDNNFNNDVIDYQCDYINDCYKPFFVSDGKIINSLIRGVLFGKTIRKKRKNFNEFLENNLNLSKKKYNAQNISNVQNDYANIITGSDQVWSPVSAGFDKAYFLPFVTENHKFSYAASIGEKDLSNELMVEYKSRLNGYNCVSVREETAKDLILKIDSTKDVHVNVDPTLLLDKSKWEDLAEKTTENQPYLLIFNVEKPIHNLEFAKNLAKKNNLKIIYINDRTVKKDKDIKYYEAVSPKTFLSLFLNASTVVTNSFHGTVFSIIFEKDLYVELDNKKKFNVRAEALLKMVSINDRIIDNENAKEKYDDIDWVKVKNILETKREESLNYFKSILPNEKNDIPVLFDKKENCCGCTACYVVCPVSAISMKEDEEGFLYPVIDESKCIKCKKCLSVCSFKQAQKRKGYLDSMEVDV